VSLRKFYAALEDESGVVRIHPKMLLLCQAHKAGEGEGRGE
jgi:hypothetical protein